jgi:hypothetical protein
MSPSKMDDLANLLILLTTDGVVQIDDIDEPFC